MVRWWCSSHQSEGARRCRQFLLIAIALWVHSSESVKTGDEELTQQIAESVDAEGHAGRSSNILFDCVSESVNPIAGPCGVQAVMRTRRCSPTSLLRFSIPQRVWVAPWVSVRAWTWLTGWRLNESSDDPRPIVRLNSGPTVSADHC